MPVRLTRPVPTWLSSVVVLLYVAWFSSVPVKAQVDPADLRADHFATFSLPEEWQTDFWTDPDVEALLALEPEKVADLVPKQAGLHHARCPSCNASEAEDALGWSVQSPELLTCSQCKESFPNEAIPAKVENAVPSEKVEVRPGVTHSYPYHTVKSADARFPGERIYIDAKRDDRARTFLAKFALYAVLLSTGIHRRANATTKRRFWLASS